MGKLVALKLNAGTLEAGFSVTLQIGEEGLWPAVEMSGSLPSTPELQHTYQRWQVAYRRLGLPYRLESKRGGFATNVSRVEDCREMAQLLSQQFNQWLSAESFRPLQDKLLEKLDSQETVRLIVQTQQTAVQRLPWQTWQICDRFPKAEIALSAPTFERVVPQVPIRSKVRVLAILGHNQGIDVQTDQALLNHLPNADVKLLVEPERQALNALLWEPEGWDILFFAGHSSSLSNAELDSSDNAVGWLQINPTDGLTISELKHALKKALERGLKIAIFNSCDGLGLAQALADLQIPQVLVMREPVPDQVAHEFLKSFLEAFSGGEPFYLAEREAREKLHGLEDRYPCATWLPVIFQNPAESPPTWASLTMPEVSSRPRADTQRIQSTRWRSALAAFLMVTTTVIGVRQLGVFQASEIWAFDQLMQLRPKELPDNRLLIIAVTEEDVQAQDPNQRRGSLSDEALSKLIEKLETMQPRVIGLDIYRDFPVLPNQLKLAKQLKASDRLYVICKASTTDSMGVKPPPEVAEPQIGFSDVVVDPDGIMRRHLLSMTPEPDSQCQATYGLGTLLALRYLNDEGIPITTSEEGTLQVGAVVFDPLMRNFGGYQTVDAGGHQIFLNYRHLKSPDLIADQVTLGDVLANRVAPDAIRDRIVLIGTTDRSFGDYWETPYRDSSTSDQEIAGVFIQAQMTSQILGAVLDNRPLIQAWPNSLEIIWILVWSGLGAVIVCWVNPLFSTKTTPLRVLLTVLLAESCLFGISWWLLVQFGYWVPTIPPALSLAAIVGATITLHTFNFHHSS